VPKKTIRKLAGVFSAAVRDADVARRSAHDPQFHKDVQEDRRGTLSRYKTVQDALHDRAAAERAAKRPAKAETTSKTTGAGKGAAPTKGAAKSRAAKKPR